MAHSALEYHRWFLRSRLRPDGLRYARAMRQPIQAPTLHLHGALDGCVLPSAARGSGMYVDAPYRWRLLDGVGHFPHEESPTGSTASCCPGSPTPSRNASQCAAPGRRA